MLNITDAVRILRKLFAGEALDFDCEKAADTDDNGIVNISDSIGLLNHLFLGESPPAAPFPDPGSDPTADDLGCAGYP